MRPIRRRSSGSGACEHNQRGCGADTGTGLASNDREGLDAEFVRDTLRFFELDEPTYRYTLKQAISEGYLVPYHIYHAKTVKTAAEDGFEVQREEIPWDQRTRPGARDALRGLAGGIGLQ